MCRDMVNSACEFCILKFAYVRWNICAAIHVTFNFCFFKKQWLEKYGKESETAMSYFWSRHNILSANNLAQRSGYGFWSYTKWRPIILEWKRYNKFTIKYNSMINYCMTYYHWFINGFPTPFFLLMFYLPKISWSFPYPHNYFLIGKIVFCSLKRLELILNMAETMEANFPFSASLQILILAPWLGRM